MDGFLLVSYIGALAFNGILAGLSLDQSVKQLPTRERIGISAYSAYSRAADLGPGRALYAIFGIAAALFALIFAIEAWLLGVAVPLELRYAAYLSGLLAVLHSLMTARAAPTLFSQREYPLANETQLTAVFNRFVFWQTLRCILQVLAFAVLVYVAWLMGVK